MKRVQFYEFERALEEIREDAVRKNGEILIVKLDSTCKAMLQDAHLLTADGVIKPVPWNTVDDDDRADAAEIYLREGGDAVVSFHVTRPARTKHRPNGIRYNIHEHAYVILVNVGEEAITVDGDWIKPGGCTALCEAEFSDPEVQEFFWQNFMQRSDVQREISNAQSEYTQRQ